ncbi:MAG: QueT transporter family protein [Candidatus Zixiibacteriota bacterium]
MRLKELAVAGLVAAVYVVATLAFLPISFGVYQVRVAEALTVLPFLSRAAIPGLFVGCLLANIFGGMGWQDVVFGSLLTLAAAFLTHLTAKLPSRPWTISLMAIPVLLLWGAAIFLLDSKHPSPWTLVCVVLSVGLLVFSVKWGSRSPRRDLTVLAVRILSFALALLLLYLVSGKAQGRFFLLGGLSLLAAWVVTWGLSVIWARDLPPNILLAPLPPVILNAFGVALYLAPLMGVSYWFAVQMIGVGELIACYLIGLPLLALLQRRSDLFVL